MIFFAQIWIFCRCAEKRKDGFIMARFTLPRDLYFGKGAMEELRTALAGYKKGFIVVGGHSMQKNGFLAKL